MAGYDRIKSMFLDLMRCPSCNGSLEILDIPSLRCMSCGSSYDVINNIPILKTDHSLKTSLEELDYDKVHGINEKMIDNTARQWLGIIETLGRETDQNKILEVGAGTGALTLGLLRNARLCTIIATDISTRFLDQLYQHAQGDKRLMCVNCDGNVLPFNSGAFDLVLGRSILHHLIDYKITLGRTAELLKPGGAGIFFEPIIQGKMYIAHLVSLIVSADQSCGESVFTKEEINKLNNMVQHITKATWYPQTREKLLKLEDKYIFDIEELKSNAREMGFSHVEFVNQDGNTDLSYWSYFLDTMGILGIERVKFKQFEWMAKSFRETIGVLMGDRLPRPMGYFVFIK